MTPPGTGMPAYVRQVAEAARTTRLSPVKTASPREAQETVLLVSVVRNERGTLPEFLAHYRRLGIQRFVIVDNASTDGSTAFLADQPDVDLYTSRQSFRWPRKQAWINRIIALYGYDRWYLYVDADEYLVFDGADPRSITDLIGFAERLGLRRIRGMLVDMYGAAPLLAPAQRGTPLPKRFPYFDGNSYSERLILTRISRTGGPRQRAFSHWRDAFSPELSKYPLFHVRPGEIFHSPHYLFPYRENYLSPCYIGLLHYKFTDNFLEKAMVAVRERSYWQDSFEYRRYLERLADGSRIRLIYSGTCEYRSPADLVATGLIERIAWPRRAGALRRLLTWPVPFSLADVAAAPAVQNQRAADISPSRINCAGAS
jgi:glycosyltransferase involved in cell wall biosynthesis